MRIAFVGDSLTSGQPGSSFVAILRQRLPDCTLVNLGRGNDTVISLYRRISRVHFAQPFDLAFLLIGINDVADHPPRSFRVVNALLRQVPARDTQEFCRYYGATLDVLCRQAKRVIAVSPLLKGEDISSTANRKVEQLAGVIQDLATQYAQVDYVDARSAFIRELDGKRTTDYLPTSVLRVMADTLTLRSDAQIDRKAAERGLHLTLDGIHLNRRGAEMVAEAFEEIITTTAAPLP
jgi:lysophospholipase L1-like esterase